ncbi:hypothetical protein [Actinomadura atramentaria]|uniref:hypothetical protein n=1 Tax=Actinomadura atramentaria TaxID=1990 RepID=UPI000362018F|nr:hypothetical protein [Actinomadura atramentaria]
MSSGVEADIVLDAAVVLTLGMNRVLGRGGAAAGRGAQLLAALAAGRAESRAAALAEAETYERALREVLERNARAEALAATRDELGADVALPAPLTPGDETVAELTAWCADADRALDAAEAALAGVLAARVGEQVFAVPAEVPAPRAAEAAPEPPDLRAALERVLARLLPDAADADRAAVARAARLLADAATGQDAQGALTEVRLRVQEANDRTREHRARERRRAAEAEAAERAADERRYVLESVTAAFEDLGYEVRAGFETLTAADGALLLTRGDWPDHSVKMRVEDAGRVRAALVRERAARGEDDRRLDVEREEQWCAAFEEARARLAAAGVAAAVAWRLEPGVRELPVMRADGAARQTGARAAGRERERGR